MRPLIIGLGRSGGQILNWFLEEVWDDITPETLAVDINGSHLDDIHAKEKIQLGEDNPAADLKTLPADVGRMIVNDEMDCLRPYLDEHNPIWLVTGLGGGFGTEAAPALASEAQKAEKYTFGAVSFPFDFEPEERIEKAERGHKQLELFADEVFSLRLELTKKYLKNDQIHPHEYFTVANQVMANLLYFLMKPVLRDNRTDEEALDRLCNLSSTQKRNLMKNAFAPGWSERPEQPSVEEVESLDDERPFFDRILQEGPD